MFRIFAWAFLLLGIERIVHFLKGGMMEVRAGMYLMRCIAFLQIIWVVVDKNWQVSGGESR